MYYKYMKNNTMINNTMINNTIINHTIIIVISYFYLTITFLFVNNLIMMIYV